ncbi:unnamed protein product [Trifolium pratense]|uniref:Uncharacterized protein n=1 Tax=Trifolium pratense TaxID=57577 RepID=A0ACB0I6T7_TRIPR|nr:unnamed protein product [Trifolium pratense]
MESVVCVVADILFVSHALQKKKLDDTVQMFFSLISSLKLKFESKVGRNRSALENLKENFVVRIIKFDSRD